MNKETYKLVSIGLAVLLLVALIWIYRSSMSSHTRVVFRREGYSGEKCVDYMGGQVPCQDDGHNNWGDIPPIQIESGNPPYGYGPGSDPQTAPINCQRGPDGRCM